MHTAVHVGVVALVIIRQGLDHRRRLLRRGGIVQVHELVSIDVLQTESNQKTSSEVSYVS